MTDLKTDIRNHRRAQYTKGQLVHASGWRQKNKHDKKRLARWLAKFTDDQLWEQARRSRSEGLCADSLPR